MRGLGIEPRSHRWQRRILTTKLPAQHIKTKNHTFKKSSNQSLCLKTQSNY